MASWRKGVLCGVVGLWSFCVWSVVVWGEPTSRPGKKSRPLGRVKRALPVKARETRGQKEKESPAQRARESRCLQKEIPRLLAKAKKAAVGRRPALLLRGLRRRCRPLPPPVKFFLKTHPAGRLPGEGPSLLRDKPILQQYPRYWERACPGFPLKKFALLERLAADKKERYVYKHCKGEGTAVMSPQELQGGTGGAGDWMSAAVLYQWLLDRKVAKDVARSFVRRGYLSLSQMNGTPLLPSRSGVPFRQMATVQATPKALLANYVMVCPLKKGRVAPRLKEGRRSSSLVIVPLWERLKRMLSKQKKIAQYTQKPPLLQLALIVDPQAPSRLLLEMMHTARRAGFQGVSLVVGQERVPFVGGARMIPLLYPPGATRQQPSSKGSLSLGVTLSPRGFTLKVNGKKVGPGCRLPPAAAPGQRSASSPRTASPVTLANKGAKPDYRELQRCLQKVKKRFSQAKRMDLSVAPAIPFRSLLFTIEASRLTAQGRLLFPEVSLSLHTAL